MSGHHSRGRRWRRAVTLGVAAIGLLASACGSTVQQQGQAPTAGAQATGELGAEAGPASTAGAGPGGAGPGGTATAGSGAVAGVSPTGSTLADGSDPASSEDVDGPASAAGGGPVLVGYNYVDQTEGSSFTESVGQGLALADARRIFQILVDDINANGGIAGGRPIEPVYHRISLSDSTAQVAATTCAAFTQDTRVFAFITGWSSDALDSCLQDAGVVEVTDNALHLSSDYQRLPLLAEPPAIALDRFGGVFARQLIDAGFVSPGARIGVLYHDMPQWRAALDQFRSTLQAAGLDTTDEVGITPPTSETDQGGVLAQTQSAVLRFKGENITHVLFFERSEWMAAGFALDAEQQLYRPQYAYHSQESAPNLAANLPPAQLRDAMVVGYWPPHDTTDEAALPEAGRQCLQMLRDNGVEISSVNQRHQAAQLCETVGFFRALMDAGGAATPDGFLAGVDRLGTTYSTRATFSVRIDRAHRDGASAVRIGGYDPSCSCFVYRSDVIPIPR